MAQMVLHRDDGRLPQSDRRARSGASDTLSSPKPHSPARHPAVQFNQASM